MNDDILHGHGFNVYAKVLKPQELGSSFSMSRIFREASFAQRNGCKCSVHRPPTTR